MKVRRPYAFCCIEGGGRIEGCSKPNHGHAIVDVRSPLPGDEILFGDAPDPSPERVSETGEVCPHDAIAALIHGQEQADMHGERVKVSRQALDEVINYLYADGGPIPASSPAPHPVGGVGEVEALIAELRPLIDKAAGPNGWDWAFPLRVVPVDGKPTIVSHKGGNLFRGYIGTWQEADLLVALANAAPRILAALLASPGTVGEGER